jgi:hypothetical protein
MACKSCASNDEREFAAEMNLHIRGAMGTDKPAVLLFPIVVVCLNCGCTEFDIPQTELRLLKESAASV